MSYVLIPAPVWRKVQNDLDFLKQTIKPLVAKAKPSEWVSEEEAKEITHLGSRSLLDKRKAGVFNWRTATGRKIEYLRKDIESYKNKFSTAR